MVILVLKGNLSLRVDEGGSPPYCPRGGWCYATDRVEEANHFLKVLLGIHTHAVTALGNEGCLGLDTGCLQDLIELPALTAGNDVVLLTMEDDDGRGVGIHVGRGAEAAVLVGLLREFGV